MPGQIRKGGASTPPAPLLLSMHKSRGSKIYLSIHKSMVYVLIYFGKLYLYTLTCKKLISEKRFKFQFSLSFQGLTNFRSSKGCGCHFWNIQRAGHLFLCSTTFSVVLLECPFAHFALKCSLFILFCISFLPSLNCKIIYWLSQ